MKQEKIDGTGLSILNLNDRIFERQMIWKSLAYVIILGLVIISGFFWNGHKFLARKRSTVDCNVERVKSPRWAVLWYGLPKQFSKLAYPSLSWAVLQQLPGDTDIFVSTYNLKVTSNPRNGEKEGKVDLDGLKAIPNAEIKIHDWNESLQILKPDLERAKQSGDAWKNGFISLRNLFLAYHLDCKLRKRIR